MNKPRYIPVFVDAKPQENLDPSKSETRSLVGVIASSMAGVPGLRDYKNTRPKRRKLAAAARIVDHLERGEIVIDAVGIVGKTDGQYIAWAVEILNRNCSRINAKWELSAGSPRALLWQGARFPLSHALGLSVYASILPLLGLRVALITKEQNVRDVKMLLDALPLGSDVAMRLLDELRHDRNIKKMWAINMKYGHKFACGNLGTYEDSNGHSLPGKDHPNMVMVDWLAVACIATVNPDQLAKEANWSDSEISMLAAIWSSAALHGSSEIINVDDIVPPSLS